MQISKIYQSQIKNAQPLKPNKNNLQQPIENNYAKSVCNPNYYKALNGVSFKGEGEYKIENQEETIKKIMFMKIFSTLIKGYESKKELISDTITTTDSFYDEEESFEDYSKLTFESDDLIENDFLPNLFENIKDDNAKLELAFGLQELYRQEDKNFIKIIEEKARTLTSYVMGLSKTNDGYDLSNFDKKLNLAKKITQIEENIIGTIFDDIIEYSTIDGKVDLTQAEKLIKMANNASSAQISIDYFSRILNDFSSKDVENSELIQDSIVDLSKNVLIIYDGMMVFERIFENSFNPKTNKFELERYNIVKNIIEGFDDENRTWNKIEEIARKDINVDEAFVVIINKFFEQYVDNDKTVNLTPKEIDEKVCDIIDTKIICIK